MNSEIGELLENNERKAVLGDSGNFRRHSLQVASTIPGSHVRFDPEIVAYPSQSSPTINNIGFNKGHARKRTIQKEVIEYMQKIQNDGSLSNNLARNEELHSGQPDLSRSSKNWDIVRQKLQNEREFFFSKRQRVMLFKILVSIQTKILGADARIHPFAQLRQQCS